MGSKPLTTSDRQELDTEPESSDSDTELTTLLTNSSRTPNVNPLSKVKTPGGIPEKDPDLSSIIYPTWVEIIGYCIGLFPVLSIPLFMIINTIDFRRNGQALSELITVQPEHPSVRYDLPDPAKYKLWSSQRLKEDRETRLIAEARVNRPD